MLTTKLPFLVERYLSQATHFTPASAAPPPSAFTKLAFLPGELFIGTWRAPGLSEDEGILISSLGVRGCDDGWMTFVPYWKISELRIPDPDVPEDKAMSEITFYTNEETCVLFPLFDDQRNHREATILFEFLSAIVSIYSGAVFQGLPKDSLESAPLRRIAHRPNRGDLRKTIENLPVELLEFYQTDAATLIKAFVADGIISEEPKQSL